MPPPFKKSIVIATHNPGKYREIEMLFFTDFGSSITCLSPQALSLTSPFEGGSTFAENALIKAKHAFEKTNKPSLADDSGLIVDALQGAPGIHSARYAGENANDDSNLEKLIHAMKAIPIEKRTARFCCAFAFVDAYQQKTSQGLWEGYLLNTPTTTRGFGYEPLFYIDTYQASAAELPKIIKNEISHRAKAWRCMKEHLASWLNSTSIE